jgi:hypothetical protein
MTVAGNGFQGSWVFGVRDPWSTRNYIDEIIVGQPSRCGQELRVGPIELLRMKGNDVLTWQSG